MNEQSRRWGLFSVCEDNQQWHHGTREFKQPTQMLGKIEKYKNRKLQFYERHKIKITDLKSLNIPICISHHRERERGGKGSSSDLFLRNNTPVFLHWYCSYTLSNNDLAFLKYWQTNIIWCLKSGFYQIQKSYSHPNPWNRSYFIFLGTKDTWKGLELIHNSERKSEPSYH